MKKRYIAIALAAAAAAGVAVWQNVRLQRDDLAGIAAVNGRVELNRMDVATLYAGRVVEIAVNEGDSVKAGDTLARLSSDQTKTQVDSALAQKQRMQETVGRATAEIESQQQQANVAKLDLDNAVKMRAEDLISQSELQRRQAAYKAALAAVAAAKAARAEALASVNQAQAQMENASSQNEDMLIKAPKAGWVEYRVAEPGNVLAAGGRVVSLLDPTDTYLNVFLTAPQVNNVKVGDEARIVIDGVNAVFPAKITYAAREAQFTPKSVETAEDRAKLMFKVKLNIPEDVALKYEKQLKGGMTAVGYVKYDRQAQWPETLKVKLP